MKCFWAVNENVWLQYLPAMSQSEHFQIGKERTKELRRRSPKKKTKIIFFIFFFLSQRSASEWKILLFGFFSVSSTYSFWFFSFDIDDFILCRFSQFWFLFWFPSLGAFTLLPAQLFIYSFFRLSFHWDVLTFKIDVTFWLAMSWSAFSYKSL